MPDMTEPDTTGEPSIVDEHFIPSLGLEMESYVENGDVDAVHHLVRSQWALRVLEDHQPIKNILDVACGAGYGSYLYAERFPSVNVVGIDYDVSAVEHAKKHYVLPNLEFRAGNVTLWDETIGNMIFDCMISFDTIEHVEHREIMMEAVVSHLSKNGRLLFSTPCGWLTTRIQPEWAFHKIEYSAASLYDFLSRYFVNIHRPEDPDFPHLEVFDEIRKRGIDYYNCLNPCICSSPIRVNNPYKGELPDR